VGNEGGGGEAGGRFTLLIAIEGNSTDSSAGVDNHENMGIGNDAGIVDGGGRGG
jgi:hypothetical protein